jgi:hypothetical protein
LDGIRAAHALRRFHNTERHNDHADGERQQEGPSGRIRGLKSLLCGGGEDGTATRVVGLASLLDRVVALAALAALCVPFLASHLGQPLIAVWMLGALGLALAVAAWCVRGGGFMRWREVVGATAWTLFTHAANILAMGAIFQALAPGLGLWRELGLAFEAGPIIILSSAVPLTPLGLGVADATGEALLARHGLDCGSEAVMLTRAIWLGVCLLSGIAFWTNEGTPEAAR